MTINKAQRFQDELRKLFEKFGIVSGFAMFVESKEGNADPLIIESHVSEKNQFIELMINSIRESLKQLGTNVWEHTTGPDEN